MNKQDVDKFTLDNNNQSLYTNHGCTTDRDRKVATMGDVVCG